MALFDDEMDVGSRQFVPVAEKICLESMLMLGKYCFFSDLLVHCHRGKCGL